MFQGGSLWAGMISGGISQLQDTTDLTKGKMDKKEFTVQTAENVTSAVGVMAGIEYGALLGTTVMPGIGTAAGAVLGGILGDRVGRLVGYQTGYAIVNNRMMRSGEKSIVQEDNVNDLILENPEKKGTYERLRNYLKAPLSKMSPQR